MATRLVEAGHDVAVWNRSEAAADPLIAAGARRAHTPGEALATGLSFSMLADDAAAERVLEAASVAEGSGIHVNMASISLQPPTDSRSSSAVRGSDTCRRPSSAARRSPQPESSTSSLPARRP